MIHYLWLISRYQISLCLVFLFKYYNIDRLAILFLYEKTTTAKLKYFKSLQGKLS